MKDNNNSGSSSNAILKILFAFLMIMLLIAFLPSINVARQGYFHSIDDAMDFLSTQGYTAYANSNGNWIVTGNATVNGTLGVTGTSTLGTADITTLNAPTGRGATVVVAASDAAATEKAQADYTVSGNADDEIIAAIAALPVGGGTVKGLGQTWSLSHAIELSGKSNITLDFEGIFSITAGFVGSTNGFVFEINGGSYNTLKNFKLNLGSDQTIPSILIYQSPNAYTDNVEVYGDGIGGGNMGVSIYQSEYSMFNRVRVHDMGEATDLISQASGFDVKGTSHVTFNNCEAYNLIDPERAGWEIEDSNTDLILNNCKSHDNAGLGFEAHVHGAADQNRIRLVECEAFDNGANGVILQGSVGGTSSDFSVEGGIYRNNGATAIKFVNAVRTSVRNAYVETASTLNDWALVGVEQVENNIFFLYTNVGSYGLIQTGDGSQVIGNKIFGTSLSSRIIWFAGSSIVNDNYLQSGGLTANSAIGSKVTNNFLDSGDIVLTGASSIIVEGNTVDGYIAISNATYCQIKNNLVGVAADTTAFDWSSSNGTYNVIEGNTIRATQYATIGGAGGGYNTYFNNNFTAATVRPFYTSPLATDITVNNWGFNTLLNYKSGSESVADDADIGFYPSVSGFGIAQIGNNTEYGFFSFTSAGAVTLISNSANCVNTDTDTKFCIYPRGGNAVGLKNRLGSTQTIRYQIWFSS